MPSMWHSFAARRRQRTDKQPPRAQAERRYISEFGQPIRKPADVAAVSFGMVVLALAIGFIIGLLVFGVLRLSSALTELVWHGALAGELPWFTPVIICGAGGLIIGLWSKYVGGDTEPLHVVLGQVKRTGTYKLKSIPASVVGFLLPLVFGGSVGLEAGLTGLIAAACSYIGTTLKRAGLRAKAVADLSISAALTAIFGTPLAGIVVTSEEAMPHSSGNEEGAAVTSDEDLETAEPDPAAYTFRRRGKIVLYTATAFGSIGGLMLLTRLFGKMAGIPHFDAVQASGADLLWFIPCVAIAYVLTVVHCLSERASERVAKKMERFTVFKPLVCGLCIGIVAIWLPYVLFCGEEQAFELQKTWQASGAVVLIATGFVKAVATSFCLNMGWRGGNFFPNIYAGISCGYGIALLSGADPMLCVTVVTSAFLAGIVRRPLIVLALLILCFPLESVIWMGLACVLGSSIPVPAVLQHSSMSNDKTA